MHKLLIVVGPLEESLLTLPVGEHGTDPGHDTAQPSFWAESPRSEGERMVSPRDDRSYQ